MTTKAPTAVEIAAREHRNSLVELRMWEDAHRKTPSDANVVWQLEYARKVAECRLEAYGAAVRSELETNAGWYKQA